MKSLLFAVSALGACALQAGAPLEKTLGRAAYAGPRCSRMMRIRAVSRMSCIMPGASMTGQIF